MQAENRLLAVGTLIEIFYSLAIVSGIEHVVDVLLTPGATGSALAVLVAGGGALMLALGDWAVYHVFVAHLGYRRILRVVADLLIIVTIFIAFRCVEDPMKYCVTVLVYFILGASYVLFLQREHKLPPRAVRLSILQFGLGILCAIILICLKQSHLSGDSARALVALVCAIWGVVNLTVANEGLAKVETRISN